MNNCNSELKQNGLTRMLRSIKLIDILTVVSLVAEIAIFAYLTDGRFLSAYNIKSMLIQSAIYLVAALGVTYIMTTGNMIEFSAGGIVCIATAVTCVVSQFTSPLVTILICFGVALAFASLISVVNLAFNVPTFIVGIVLMQFSSSFTSLFYMNFTHSAAPWLSRLGDYSLYLFVALAAFIVCAFIFTFTKSGKHIKAVGSNPSVAMNSGINVKKYSYLAYLIYGVLIGLCALLTTIRLGAFSTTVASTYPMEILLMLIVGGIPLSGGSNVKIRSSLIGVLVFIAMSSGLKLVGVSVYYIDIIRALIFFTIVSLTYDRSSTKFVL